MSFFYKTVNAVVCALLWGTLPIGHAANRQKRYIYINPEAPITLGLILNMPIALALPTLTRKGRSVELYDDEYPEDLEYDSAYESIIEKLLAYFAHMEILTVSCQQRFICELAWDPDSYSPVSETLLKEIAESHGPMKKDNSSLMWKYMSAAHDGFTSSVDACSINYPNCSYGVTDILHLPILKVWQFLMSRFNIQIV